MNSIYTRSLKGCFPQTPWKPQPDLLGELVQDSPVVLPSLSCNRSVRRTIHKEFLLVPGNRTELEAKAKPNICWLITNPEREGWWRGETPGKLVRTAKTFLSTDHRTVSVRSGFQQEMRTHLSLKGTVSVTVLRGDEGEELVGHVPGVPESQRQPCPTCCTAPTEAGELYSPRTLYRQGEKSRRTLEIKTFRVSYPNRNDTLNFGSIIAFGRITLVALQFFVQVSCSFILFEFSYF